MTRFSGAGDRGRTDTVSLPLDFESSTSANSITPANNIGIISHQKQKIKRFCKVFLIFLQRFSIFFRIGKARSCLLLRFVDFGNTKRHEKCQILSCLFYKKGLLPFCTKIRVWKRQPKTQKIKFFYEKW